ncbi:hypothetical protein GCM10023195_32640 [Actinoallomurus liliacearum]|uniref:Acyltransferase 3 domain-containing protein n=1 Tax=Actinoallomurus liliacearum TaxID=1080073 RepID=A0ABP8THE7_9ACTN
MRKREGASAREPGLTPAPARASDRLAWLDALRGLAVLSVVIDHLTYHLLTGLRPSVLPWFDNGAYGVMIFFLVSGYIVPASLERRGDIRGFWLGRFFRLYPLWGLALTATLGLAAAGVGALRQGLADRPAQAAIAHLTMLQDLLDVTNAINVLWTLSYEMVFYLLTTALFVFGLHRRSSGVALTFILAACGAGGVLSPLWLSRSVGTGTVILLATAALAAGLAGVVRRSRAARVAGAAILTALSLCLVTVNSRLPVWHSLVILATMFSGTALYRIEQHRPRWWGLVALVPPLSIACGLAYGPPAERWRWALTVAAAWATFAVAMLLRHRRLPPILPWIGVLSYSIYLLHPLLLDLLDAACGDRRDDTLLLQLAWVALFLAALLGASHLAHRYVEVPGQRLGHRMRAAGPAANPAAGTVLRSADRQCPGPSRPVDAP